MSQVIQPISMKTLLAPTPTQPPKYSVTVKNTQGEEVVLADPKATRALVALMDMAAVIGGAASHWGGPSAFAELMAAAHGAMFLDSQAQAKPLVRCAVQCLCCRPLLWRQAG